jgi:hypothetical protein
MAHGKSLVIPFLARPGVSSAMQVPVSRRYIKRLQSKYLLKSLLHKRLPKYPAYQRKGATLLPFAEFYTAGPLSRVWERFQMPDWCEGQARDRLLNVPDNMAKSTVTWAIWEQSVLRNPILKLIDGTSDYFRADD